MIICETTEISKYEMEKLILVNVLTILITVNSYQQEIEEKYLLIICLYTSIN